MEAIAWRTLLPPNSIRVSFYTSKPKKTFDIFIEDREDQFMMNIVRVADALNCALALGATRGAMVFDRCVELLTRDGADTVILCFDGIEATNGSFVKATLLNLLLCGKLSLDPD